MNAGLPLLHDTFARAARRAADTGTPTLASVSVPLRPLDFFDLIAAWDDGATPWCFHEAGDASVTLFGWDGALERPPPATRASRRSMHAGARSSAMR